MPTQDDVKRLFIYEPKSGRLLWRENPSYPKRWNSRYPGTVAGSQMNNGYLNVGIEKTKYLVHRIIWLYMTGAWPHADVDHIDGDRTNNAWHNLRAATRSQNNFNRRKSDCKSSSYKGVCWNKSAGRWQANIGIEGQQHHLGLFDDEAAAHGAYMNAAERLGGEFARAG